MQKANSGRTSPREGLSNKNPSHTKKGPERYHDSRTRAEIEAQERERVAKAQVA